MNILITKAQKEVLATMNKMLIDILSTEENLKLREKLKPKLATRISAHSLKKLVNKFKDIDDLHIISESSKKLQVSIPIMKRRNLMYFSLMAKIILDIIFSNSKYNLKNHVFEYCFIAGGAGNYRSSNIRRNFSIRITN